jgi:hypothetical protein
VPFVNKVHIKAAVREALRTCQLSPEEVIAEVEAIATSSIKDLWNESGNVMMPNQLPDWVARTVKKFKAHPTNGLEIEMYSKLEALEKLCRLHKLFTERHEVTGKDGKDIFDLEAWRKAVVESQ